MWPKPAAEVFPRARSLHSTPSSMPSPPTLARPCPLGTWPCLRTVGPCLSVLKLSCYGLGLRQRSFSLARSLRSTNLTWACACVFSVCCSATNVQRFPERFHRRPRVTLAGRTWAGRSRGPRHYCRAARRCVPCRTRRRVWNDERRWPRHRGLFKAWPCKPAQNFPGLPYWCVPPLLRCAVDRSPPALGAS